MIKRAVALSTVLLVALAAVLACVPVPAQAYLHPGSAATAPILQSVSVPFGASTPSGRGSVRLSSVDVTTTANQPVTFSGLDLWAGGSPCATWTMSFVSGRASNDYNLIAANTPEGTGALAPNPRTGTSITGSYVWNVSCTDASSNVSNTVTLTYATVANAVNIGTYDRTDFGVTPSGFGGVAGAQILLGVGADFHAPGSNQCCTSIRWDVGTYANLVTITNADNARKPYNQSFVINNATAGQGMANFQVQDLTLSGQLASSQNVVAAVSNLAGTDHVTFKRIHGFYSYQYALGNFYAGNSGQAFYIQGCTTNAVDCGLSDSDFDYLGSGLNPQPYSYVHNSIFRHYYNNCIFYGSTHDVDIEDTSCIAPLLSQSGGFNVGITHVDNCQIGDGASPWNITMKRDMFLQGDGDTQVQGCPFVGTPINAGCYQDDGTGTHGAGVVLTCPGGFQSSSNGSYIAMVGHYDYTTRAQLTVTSGTQGTLSNVSAAVIGSPGSPVQTYTAGQILDWTMDGIIVAQSQPNGWGSNGDGGTSVVRDFSFFQMNATPPGVAQYTGSIVGATGVLTVTSVPTHNYPGEVPCLIDCGRFNIPGVCAYCNSGISTQISGTLDGIGTYNTFGWAFGDLPSQTIQNGQGYPWPDNQVGGLSQGLCNTTLHTGSLAFINGTVQGGASLCGAPVTNTTTTNLLAACCGAAMPAANYASGLTPQTYLQGKTWSSRVSTAPLLTNAQIMTMNCLAVKPKIGGGLDLGGGLWSGPVTGETNAGTHTGGGNWIQNGTDSGIAIPGCSAAP